MTASAVGDRVAVLYMMHDQEGDGMLRVHAAVPYVSSLQHISYPHITRLVDSRFADVITAAVVTLQIEFDLGKKIRSGRVVNVPYHAVLHPQLVSSQGPSYKEHLVKAARAITKELHMERIVEFLFSLEDYVELLQIFTDVPQIPWDWLYNERSGRFLGELFGIGVTTPEEECLGNVLFSRRDKSLSLEELRSAGYTGLIAGSAYAGTPHCLPGNMKMLAQLREAIAPILGEAYCVADNDITTDELQAALEKDSARIRVMVLSGHFGEDGFRCDDGYFAANDVHFSLERAKRNSFEAHPVVFLNGCMSGPVGPPGRIPYVESQRSLAQAFLRRGAGACVFTSAPVHFEHAARVARSFWEHFLTPGVTIGSALLAARKTIPMTECFEWATYHLLGDPTYVMVRSEAK